MNKIYRRFFVIYLIYYFAFANGESIQEVEEEIALNFIIIRGMKMDEYNFWWAPVSLSECADKCLQDQNFVCRSFSYSTEAEACSAYEKTRATAPPAFYNPPGVFVDDPYGIYHWDYFEKKSAKYRTFEEQVNRLKNLTEISIGDAGTVLNWLADSVGPSPGQTSIGNAGVSISPSELEIAAQSLLLVMKLNPVSKAPLDGVEDFAGIAANVSSVLIHPSHTEAWKVTQKSPASSGVADIVTSAEVLCNDVSERLLTSQNGTKAIMAEATSIAFWIDVVEGDPATDAESRDRARGRDALSSFNFQQSSSSSSSSSSQNYGGGGGGEGENQHSGDSPESGGDSGEGDGAGGGGGGSVYSFPQNQPKERTATTAQPGDGYSTFSTQPTEEGDFLQDWISLPKKALGQEAVVVNVRYKGIDKAMPTRKEDVNDLPGQATVRSSFVNSAVITTSVYPRPPIGVFDNHPVVIVFKHERAARGNITGVEDQPPAENATDDTSTESTPRVTSEEVLHCVYWEAGGGSGEGGGAWSTRGCEVVDSNETHTTCECVHLTSFAILLQIVDYNIDEEISLVHRQALSIISTVGCILSLLGVVVMCAAFIKLKFHTENMKIHFNLGVAVGLADLIFLFESLAEGAKSWCLVVTILLYYFNMTVLAWMLIEGVHLYAQVVVVFVSARRWFRYYIVAGWGIPVVILAISMGILNVKLGTNGICWLSPHDNSIWAFAAPALLVILINTVILITVVKVIVNIEPEKSNHVKASKFRNAVKGSIFLFPLLGTTWLFGLLSLSEETLMFQYVFATVNSLQGFFLFVFHCLCNSEVREDARRHKWFGTSRGSPASPHSGILGLNVANGLRRFRNSISFEMPSSNSENDVTDDGQARQKKLGKLLHIFPQIFSTTKFPATIKEEGDEENYSEDHGSIPSSASTSRPSSSGSGAARSINSQSNVHIDVSRNVPLPGMPVKNDQIITGLNMPLPKEAQIELDVLLAERLAATKSETVDYLKEDDGIGRSYDSGLNSIDNESILDEEDSVWMAQQNLPGVQKN